MGCVNIQQHIKECPYQQLSCPNGMQLCLPFLRKELEKHDNECQSYTCPYSPEGCTFIGTRNQVNIHCEGYCGRLHKSIDDLTEQIKRLNTMIQNMSIGLDIQQPSPPVQQEDLVEKDQEMNEMALFREMLNGDLFESLNLSDPKKGENTPPALPNLMDLGSLDFLDTLSNDFKFDQPAEATSPKPLKFVPPTTVPKRTTNGKKIRYSKNIQLAHSAMRAARERTAESLNDQHVIQQKNNQLALKHAVDSNKTHNDDSKSKKKKPVEPVITDPKRRPMFILASSYLSNYTATP
ncbi:hypothetical protein G6F56_009835 [Rhizopus delemar]|nr:hypothetical protein G6F56_009835 [Rhizopus delemar]